MATPTPNSSGARSTYVNPISEHSTFTRSNWALASAVSSSTGSPPVRPCRSPVTRERPGGAAQFLGERRELPDRSRAVGDDAVGEPLVEAAPNRVVPLRARPLERRLQ